MKSSLDIDNLTLSIDSKFIGNRDGSCCRTAQELAHILIDDACCILAIPEPSLPDEDEEFIHDVAREYDDMLNEHGFTVVWDDGYTIYKDLTEEELEYLFASTE